MRLESRHGSNRIEARLESNRGTAPTPRYHRRPLLVSIEALDANEEWAPCARVEFTVLFAGSIICTNIICVKVLLYARFVTCVLGHSRLHIYIYATSVRLYFICVYEERVKPRVYVCTCKMFSGYYEVYTCWLRCEGYSVRGVGRINRWDSMKWDLL